MEPMRLDVARGRVRFCLGYTEPDGGSDIAAAKVRAVQDGDEWVINGSKIFTTGAQNCQYVFLITRTDPTLPKHKGMTMFLVPLDTPGVEIQGIRAFSGERTNIVYYSECASLTGTGWARSTPAGRCCTARWTLSTASAARTPDFGRAPVPCSFATSKTLSRSTVHWAQTAVRADGSRVADDRVAPVADRAERSPNSRRVSARRARWGGSPGLTRWFAGRPI